MIIRASPFRCQLFWRDHRVFVAAKEREVVGADRVRGVVGDHCAVVQRERDDLGDAVLCRVIADFDTGN